MTGIDLHRPQYLPAYEQGQLPIRWLVAGARWGNASHRTRNLYQDLRTHSVDDALCMAQATTRANYPRPNYWAALY